MAAALEQAGIEPPADAAALAELAGGSVGAAVRLVTLDGLDLYAELVTILSGLPEIDRARAVKLADSVRARRQESGWSCCSRSRTLLLARLARTGATGAPPAAEAAPGEAGMLARLAPDPRRARPGPPARRRSARGRGVAGRSTLTLPRWS